jgi:hypothetical protein
MQTKHEQFSIAVLDDGAIDFPKPSHLAMLARPEETAKLTLEAAS